MTITTTLKIKGMNCASCAGRVEKALSAVDGVTQASVNLATETAAVTGDVPTQALEAAVLATGYQLEGSARQFAVKGMSCASCAGRVEKSLLKVSGVLAASVNLATEQVSLRLTNAVSDDSLAQAVANAGYELVLAPTVAETEIGAGHGPEAGGTAPNQLAFYQQDSWPVIGAALLTIPLVLPMFGMLVGFDWMLPAFWQWLLATPVQFYFGARFYQAG
jgi:Cu+-exporting ATPase